MASHKYGTLKEKRKNEGKCHDAGDACDEQKDGEPCLSVTGLYVPYEQNFVVETNFYFCPSTSFINRPPPWTNLRKSQRVHARKTISDQDINKLDFQQMVAQIPSIYFK